MHDKQVRRRRAVLALLVVISLILLTAYFGASSSSPLHQLQQGIVTALSPVQDGASKVLKPFADIPRFFSDAFKAKSQVAGLRKQVQTLNQEVARYQAQSAQNQQLRKEVGLDDTIGIDTYHPIAANVIQKDPQLWYQTIEVDKGSADGISREDPVVGPGGLVGKVTSLGSNYAIISLITDHTMSVAATVQDSSGDWGLLVPKVGDPTELLLQDLPQPKAGDPGPSVGSRVVTAGFRSGSLDSLYPPGILIGTISNANQNDLVNNGQVQVAPAVDLRHLQTVQILTAPHAGTTRASLTTP